MIRDDRQERGIPVRSPEPKSRLEPVRMPVEAGERARYSLRDRTYLLSDSQKTLLNDVGTFRVIRTQDVVQHVYGGDQARFDREVHYLLDRKLVAYQDAWKLTSRPQTGYYLTLGKVGKELTNKVLKTNLDQAIYSGIKKPNEVEHDSQLYRMFKHKESELRSQGFTPKRVVIDYEFKKAINSRMAKVRKGTEGYRHAQSRVAAENKLVITNGKIAIPDVRVEYETEGGTHAHCDLELVSENYRSGQIAEKKAAGFALYASANGGRKVRNIDFMEDLISL